MRIQYNGDKIKIIPKKYSVIKDVGKFFMADSKRLTIDERLVLDKQIGKMIRKEFDLMLKEFTSKLQPSVRQLIIGSDLKCVRWIKRRTESPYPVLRFSNKVEVKCENQFFTLGKKALGIQTETLNGSY